VGQRQVQRLRRAEGLRLPPTQAQGPGTLLPTPPCAAGRSATLTVLDEYTRECHVRRADRTLKSADVIALVKEAIERPGASEYIRSDNGPEFIAQELQRWLVEAKIKTRYTDPASPWQNGFVESLHSRFCDECLNREQLWTLTEARVVIEDFRRTYNSQRPPSKLGCGSPARFAAQLLPSPGSGRHPSVGDGQTQPAISTSDHCPA
jgi:transposase InsO family protein